MFGQNLLVSRVAGDIIKFLVDIPYFTYLFIASVTNILIRSLPRKRKTLNGETILITGAASGLGQRVVLKLAKLFPQVVFVLWDINKVGLSQTKEQCEKLGADKVFIYSVDLTKRLEVVNTAELVRKEAGTVTLLFNNAGILAFGPFLDSDPVKEEKVIQTNMLAYMWTIREFLPEMVRRGSGHLISTCSVYGFYRSSQCASYAASKFGLRGFLESLKLEMNLHPNKPNIKFSTIFPAFVKTSLTQGINLESRYSNSVFASSLEPDYVAEEIVDGILKEKEEIMIPKGYKIVDLFYRLIPAECMDKAEAHVFKFEECDDDGKTVMKELKAN